MIRIFIGYDQRERIAYHALAQSIICNASVPVSITPVAKNHLKEIYNRERTDKESTEFSLTRFLVPYLSNYEGWSIFMDCDMIVTKDLKHLWDLKEDKYAVMCVKHDYSPSTKRKFLDQTQTAYEKKNWSSLMLFNNSRCQTLTPDIVQSSSGLYLHQFQWLESESMIGEVPHDWNFLVGEEAPLNDGKIPANLHYTIGGPYFTEFSNCDYSDVWVKYQKLVVSAG